MTIDTAFALGKALALSLGGDRPLIYVGTDTRESADMISQAVISGALCMGADCMFGGVMPTPAVAFNVRKKKAAAGIVISASHNPPEFNGIKVFGADAYKLSDAEEARIEDIMESPPAGYPVHIGRLYSDTGGFRAYAHYLIHTADTDLRGLRFIVDCAHGAACRTAQYIFRKLGADCIFIACKPCGRLINSGCGATHPQKAAYLAKTEGCRAAFCFDGDADRLIAADSGGNIIDGDFIMYIIARELREQGRLNSAGVVATVMTNRGVECAYKKQGIRLHRAPVGDKYVIQDMQKNGAVLGGEQSGHIIMKDYATTGDGILSALMIASALKKSDFAQLTSDIKLTPQRLVNVSVSSAAVLEDERFLARCAYWEELLSEGSGRLLVRMSGTEQKLRIMAECTDESLCAGACEDLALLSKLIAS